MNVVPCHVYIISPPPSPSFSLSNIRISNNRFLTQIPSEIGLLSNMYSINLSFNNITTLPSELANLGELITLDVSYNSISTLPLAFGQMFRRDKKRSLKGTDINVYLQGNTFNAIPSTVWEWGGPISDLDTAKPLMVDVNMSDNNISFFHHMGATAPLASAAAKTTSVSSNLPKRLDLNHNPVCNGTTGVVPREFVGPGWRVTCTPN